MTLMSLIDLDKKLLKHRSETFFQLYSDHICQFSGGNSRIENVCAVQLSQVNLIGNIFSEKSALCSSSFS